MFNISHGFWGSESGSILAEWTGSGGLVRLQANFYLKLWSLMAWLELKDILLKWLTHMADGRRPQFLACCWQHKLSSSPHGPLHKLLECPHDMAANFSQSKWSKGEQGGICDAFYDLFSQVVLYHSHFVRSESLNSAHTQREGVRLCLLKGRVSTNLWMFLKPPHSYRTVI